MNRFLLLWLSLSLSGSLVAVVLILLKPFLQKFSKTWQYYIWLLVILRLLIPISPDKSIVGSVFEQAQTYKTEENTLTNTSSEGGLLTLDSKAAPLQENNIPNKDAAAAVKHSVPNHQIWGILWLLVAVILLFKKMYGYQQLVKTIKNESKVAQDVQLITVLEMTKREMGIKKNIPIYTNPFVMAPMLIGIVRPAIIIPVKRIKASELIYIYKHELTHYRRKDIFYKWLAEIAVCFHWFNPFAYWVRKQIGRDCELSCDEAVVRCLNYEERLNYGDTLLHSIEMNHLGKKGVISLSLNEDGHLIKERLGSIMKYRQKSKLSVFIAILLTSVLLCGTVFAGNYTVVAKEPVPTGTAASPIMINTKAIASGGKISLGSQQLISGTEYMVSLTWEGIGNLTVVCTSPNGTENKNTIENGKNAVFLIPDDGQYTIAVKNNNTAKISNVKGTIEFLQSTKNGQSKNLNGTVLSNVSSAENIVYNNVEMRRYEGADGHPYIHDTMTNSTKKGIAGYQYGMLAFDKVGNPLKINWWSLDANAESTYFYLDETSTQILPGETYDVRGGWSLNILENDSAVEKIAYVLYCNKEVTFDNGTVWVNPYFKQWRTTYEGKKIDVEILENYYPYEQQITF